LKSLFLENLLSLVEFLLVLLLFDMGRHLCWSF
jgi:hypothetical protein